MNKTAPNDTLGKAACEEQRACSTEVRSATNSSATPPLRAFQYADEWRECREVVARLDTTLVELRRYGFSFVLTLLTANAIWGEQATLASTKLAAAMVMLLVCCLFYLDAYYQCLLSGAVERALDIECKEGYPISLTKYLSINARLSWFTLVNVVLYLGIVVAAYASSRVHELEQMSFWAFLQFDGLVVLALLSALFIGVYGFFVALRCGLFSIKQRNGWPSNIPLRKLKFEPPAWATVNKSDGDEAVTRQSAG
jgi:hypothetical protein